MKAQELMEERSSEALDTDKRALLADCIREKHPQLAVQYFDCGETYTYAERR